MKTHIKTDITINQDGYFDPNFVEDTLYDVCNLTKIENVQEFVLGFVLSLEDLEQFLFNELKKQGAFELQRIIKTMTSNRKNALELVNFNKETDKAFDDNLIDEIEIMTLNYIKPYLR